MSRRKTAYWILYSFQINYDFKFDPIKAYLEASKNMIVILNQDIKDKYDKWEAERDKKSNGPDAYDIFETEIMNISEFDSILNNSTFLAIFSLFENEFLNLCLWCKEVGAYKLGPKDINSGSYIGQCRSFITKLMDVNLDNLNKEWEQLSKYRKIRNSIAHGDGKIGEPPKEIISFIFETNGIEYNSEKKIVEIKNIDFLKEFIDLIKSFLNSVCTQIATQKENQAHNKRE